ncbi:protein YAE1 homolog [Pecten maximus]|uniref:protein YAE1 homolog n=1 Tax=Pecten maximus TaxID=6579 RepID=UPI001458FF75|nr:protein YAE1 homolog [Pecten maximus]
MEAQEDDIFDENATEIMIGSRDWQKMESSLTNLGYRDGMAEGQEVNVQEGFNQGYKAAASLIFNIAVLRGEISANLSMKHIHKIDMDKSTEANLEQLLQDVRELEQSCMKASTGMEVQVTNSTKECGVQSEVSKDSNETSCQDCKCKGGQGSGQDLDVQSNLEQSQKTVDIHGQLSSISTDTRSKLDTLQRRLEVIMESHVK